LWGRDRHARRRRQHRRRHVRRQDGAPGFLHEHFSSGLSWKFLTQLRNFVLSSDWDSLPNSDSLAEELLAYLGETFYPELSGCVAKKPGMDLAYLLPEDTRTVLEGLNGFLEFFEIQFVTEGFTSYALLSLDGETEYLRTEDGLLFDNLLPPGGAG